MLFSASHSLWLKMSLNFLFFNFHSVCYALHFPISIWNKFSKKKINENCPSTPANAIQLRILLFDGFFSSKNIYNFRKHKENKMYKTQIMSINQASPFRANKTWKFYFFLSHSFNKFLCSLEKLKKCLFYYIFGQINWK